MHAAIACAEDCGDQSRSAASLSLKDCVLGTLANLIRSLIALRPTGIMTVRTRRTTTASNRPLQAQFPPIKGGASQRLASSRPRAAAKSSSTTVLVESGVRQAVQERSDTSAERSPPAKRQRKTENTPPPALLPLLSEAEIEKCTTTILPPLTFSLEAGKQHLVDVDVRFESLVKRIPMRVFEELNAPKELNLFKTLVTSILGQQVSWLAARAILYKFIRLWWTE